MCCVLLPPFASHTPSPTTTPHCIQYSLDQINSHLSTRIPFSSHCLSKHFLLIAASLPTPSTSSISLSLLYILLQVIIMRPPSSLKEEFLKKWVSSLQKWSLSSKEMSLKERKEAIRLSADLAMASTRNGTTLWSRALMANATKDSDQPPMMTSNQNESLKSRLSTSTKSNALPSRKGSMQCRRRKIVVRNGRKVIRNCTIRRSRKSEARDIAERLVKKRTQVLKELVPGGVYMDESVLLNETLDYIFSLRAQVHVMQSLANATQLLSKK